MLTSSNVCIFGQFSDAVGQESPIKKHATFIYCERTFYELPYLVYQTIKNCFCFGEIDLLAIPYFWLIFAEVSKN